MRVRSFINACTSGSMCMGIFRVWLITFTLTYTNDAITKMGAAALCLPRTQQPFFWDFFMPSSSPSETYWFLYGLERSQSIVSVGAFPIPR